MAACRMAHGPGQLAWSEGQQLLGTVKHSLKEISKKTLVTKKMT